MGACKHENLGGDEVKALLWVLQSDFVGLRKSLPMFSHPESSYLCCPCKCSEAYSLAIKHSWGSSTTLARVSFLFFSITDVGLEYGFQTDCLNYQLLWVGMLLCTIHIKMTYILIHKYVSVCVCAQLCPTLCHFMDCSPLGSSLYGISQTRILEWLPFPDPGIEPASPGSAALQADSLSLSH